ncbi:MAG: methyltransferase domain-containing protein [Gemmatimonadota bacterium]
MTWIPRAGPTVERMDHPDLDPDQLEAALDHVAAVNRWLGGRRALLRHVAAGWPRGTGAARILDVGTGSGDLPRSIARWAHTRARPVLITAVDLHPATLRVARQRTPDPAIRMLRGDARRLPFTTAAFDLALLSMTLHHLDGDDLVLALRELGRVARGGRVLVGELERALPNYLGARLLAATAWRRNPITRHDGPLSVRRSFTPDELRALARRAGLKHPRVHRHAFYRLVLRADA